MLQGTNCTTPPASSTDLTWVFMTPWEAADSGNHLVPPERRESATGTGDVVIGPHCSQGRSRQETDLQELTGHEGLARWVGQHDENFIL